MRKLRGCEVEDLPQEAQFRLIPKFTTLCCRFSVLAMVTSC